jgi:hypothetical protein
VGFKESSDNSLDLALPFDSFLRVLAQVGRKDGHSLVFFRSQRLRPWSAGGERRAPATMARSPFKLFINIWNILIGAIFIVAGVLGGWGGYFLLLCLSRSFLRSSPISEALSPLPLSPSLFFF